MLDGDQEAEPVSASAFYRPSTMPSVPLLSVAPGTQPSEPPSYTPPSPPAAPGTPAADPSVSVTDPPTRLSDSVKPASPPEPAVPVTPGTGAKVPVPVGTYLTVGGVLAEVNGTPIFAARVMKELEIPLAARARETTPEAFEAEARRLIERTINEFELEELEYASAQQSLEADDKKLADLITMDYRQKLITAAGGSLEQAKRVAAESGENFDELLRTRSRRNLVGLYIQKKLLPRVEITTNDMRRYYKDNLDKEFTSRSQVTFRLIRIDPNFSGGKAPALDKITEIRARAVAGEDFGALAGSLNDDASLARNKGLLGPISPGSLAAEKVEKAAFRTDVGQISEIIEDRGGFYIVKVESKKLGAVREFEQQAVQEEIRAALVKIQLATVRESHLDDLQRNKTGERDEKKIQTAVEMAVQRYPIWRSQKPPSGQGAP